MENKGKSKRVLTGTEVGVRGGGQSLPRSAGQEQGGKTDPEAD